MIYSIFVFVVLSNRMVLGQVPFPGKCNPLKLIYNFDLERYMGKWYVIATYPYTWYIDHRCLYHVYENRDKNLINITISSYSDLTDNIFTVNRTAQWIGNTSLWNLDRNIGSFHTTNYMILDTDYDNWSIVYNCWNLTTLLHMEMVWLLSRHVEPSSDMIKAAQNVMNSNDISLKFLMVMHQINCQSSNKETNANQTDFNFFSSNRSDNIFNQLSELLLRLLRRIYNVTLNFIYN